MQEGGLDGGFWVIYTAQGALTERGYAKALAHTRHRNQVIDEMLREHGPVSIASRAEDAPRIAATGKRIVYKSKTLSAGREYRFAG